jgi:hypothetical protein
MKFTGSLLAFTFVAAVAAHAPAASALAIGQTDDFEDGTTQGWLAGLLGATHPAPPTNVASGGPLGAGDNYLQVTSLGGLGPGSRLTVLNFAAQWAGDYAGTGISTIAMDLRNLGSTDLNIRLYLENPMGGPPTDEAITSARMLAAGGGWTHVEFAVDAASLIGLLGDVNTLLSDVTVLRIFNSLDETFPGAPVIAMLGVDNITAAADHAVPEPPTWNLLTLAMLAWVSLHLRRRHGLARN